MNEILHTPKNIFRTGRYILFWVSSLLSNIGTWMQQVAQPWLVLSLSNSAFWVGLDSFAMNAPVWLFTLWGGVLADRYDRKKVVLFFQTIQFLCIITMVVLLSMGWLKVWMIVSISFLVGLTDSLSMPSFQSIIPSIVDKKDIHKAISLNSTQFNLSRILGPAIAGAVIVRFGALVCFSANAASYIPFFLSLYFIYPRRGLQLPQDEIETKPLQQLKEFKKLLLNSELRISLLVILFTNMFCAQLITFSVVLLKNISHGEITQFGWVVAAFGTGGLIGAAVTFIPFPVSFKRNIFATGVSLFLGFIILAIALNHSLYLLFALLILAGAGLTTSNISSNTFLQENAVNNARGRIVSMFQLSLSGGISIGALFTGFMVSKFNISTALLINGIFAITIQFLLLRKQVQPPVIKH